MLALFCAASVRPAQAAESRKGTWREVGRMSAGRYAPAVAVLRDGRALIAGGFDGRETVRSAELFDPKTGRLTRTGSLQVGRNFASATRLDDGTVLVAGGYREAESADGLPLGSLDSAEIYDPKTGRFTSLSVRMTARRELFTATKLPDGRVLIIGGYRTGKGGGTLASAEVYNPKTKTFREAGTMAAPYGRFGHVALLLPGGKRVLFVGGKERTPSGWHPLRSAEIYDADRETFEPVGEMAFSRDRPTVAWIESAGKALVIGGQTESDGQAEDMLETEWYDPKTRTFSPGPSLHQGRMAHAMAVSEGGSVYVSGGWSVALNRTTETMERFDPSPAFLLGGAFVELAPMPESRHDHGMAILTDGRILVVGGKKAEAREEWPRDAEIYAP